MPHFISKNSGLARLSAGIVGCLALLWAQTTPAATITVTGTGDTIAVDGLATLREAITSINNGADTNGDITLNRVGGYGFDVINFNIAGAGVKTISVTAGLPLITRFVYIDGYSQTGASVNTLANSDNRNELECRC